MNTIDDKDRYYLCSEIFVYKSKMYMEMKNYKKRKNPNNICYRALLNHFHWLRLCSELGWYSLHNDWVKLIDPTVKRKSYSYYGISCYSNPSKYSKSVILEKCLIETFRHRDAPKEIENYLSRHPRQKFSYLESVFGKISQTIKDNISEYILSLSNALGINIILMAHPWVFTALKPYTYKKFDSTLDSVILYHTSNFNDIQFIGYFHELIHTYFTPSFLNNNCNILLTHLVYHDDLVETPIRSPPTFFGKTRDKLDPYTPPPKPKNTAAIQKGNITLTW